MRTYNYSLLLLLCGGVYSLFSSGGWSGGGSKSEPENAPANTTVVEPHSTAKGADTSPPDESTYPEDLCVQFAACTSTGKPEENRMRPTGPRDDIQSPVFVIATVPDPTATHLRVEFDRTIDGIKDAAADDLFLFRRYWFPWPLEPARQFSDRASQDIEDSERAAKSRLPGLLLFDRLERGGHRSLVVLLAGESPTDGINRQQFDRAIKLKQKIEDLAKQADSAYQPGSTYYILGTTFSGSLHTLQLALREKRDPPMSHFKAISGTVSDGKSIDAFNQSFTSPEAPVHLRTLLHDTVTSLQAFRQYVYETWNYADPVAVLSETDTAFGALQGLNASGNPRDHEHFLLIPFPRDIAHLRNAYQSYPALSELGPANPDLRQSKNLPLPLEDTLNTVDSIPDYAAQTVVSQETMVSQIANRLRHDRIRFAAIIGTDVLDVLFLTRFLRSATPDTRLFLLDPDLLFVHAADALPFEGVLAVTTYPLLDGNPPFDIPAPPIGPAGASATDDRHWLFPTPFQQGIHNAMRVLLSDIVPGISRHCPAMRPWHRISRRPSGLPASDERVMFPSPSYLHG